VKTAYTAWAVQVLRDGEWELEDTWPTRGHARVWAKAVGRKGKTRVRKVRVTVEEV